jgi:putative endonuclease
MFYIYILQSLTSSNYYVGYSSNPFKRLEQHNTKPAGTYTSKHLPWKLMAVFKSPSKEIAIKLERFIKRQKSKSLIEKLCDPDFVPSGELAQSVRVPHLRD